MNIRDHIQDLLVPFQQGYLYVPAMGGSFSIKSVLPALFPNDPELDYHNLKGSVHNGGEAMDVFLRIKEMLPFEADAARESALTLLRTRYLGYGQGVGMPGRGFIFLQLTNNSV